jgi:quinol monooxygenase YgiN
MSTCTEIFVYEIAPGDVEAFLSIKNKLVSEAKTLPGLLESSTLQSRAQPNLFMDRMKWESQAAAKTGNELFQSLPTSARFMSMMAGPPKIAGQFDLVAGD